MKFFEVVGAIIVDEFWKADRCQVANSDFIFGGVFNDFAAEVGALDCSKVLLV
jgi:hypothetical protein